MGPTVQGGVRAAGSWSLGASISRREQAIESVCNASEGIKQYIVKAESFYNNYESSSTKSDHMMKSKSERYGRSESHKQQRA